MSQVIVNRRRTRGRGRRNRKIFIPKSVNLINNLNHLPTKNTRSIRAGPFPNCMIVECVTTFWNVVQGASSFIVGPEFRINDVFLPYTGSPVSASGLAGASGMYDSYHVTTTSWEVEVISNEGFPMAFAMFPRDTQPTTLLTSRALVTAAIDNGPVFASGTISSTAGVSKYVLQDAPVKLHPETVVGRPLTYLSDLSYDAAVTTNPAQVVWVAFLLLSSSAAQNLTNGVLLKIVMRQRTCFYSKKVVL
jgi:hypothetical protein